MQLSILVHIHIFNILVPFQCSVLHNSSHDMQEITHRTVVPELAFTGDTTVDFITDPANEEVFHARLLIMECTFLDDEMSPEDAKVSLCAHLLLRTLLQSMPQCTLMTLSRLEGSGLQQTNNLIK